MAINERTQLLTRAEAAAFLRVKPQTLACWKSTGRYDLPIVMVGRLPRYRRSDLEAFVAAHTLQATPAAIFGEAGDLRCAGRGGGGANAEGGGGMKTGLIYLASPYSNPDTRIRDGRFEAVCAAAARLMAEGHLIFSPIAHTHPIAIRGNLPTGWEFWMRYDHAQLDAAEELWVLDLPGWEESKGVTAEIEYMRVLGKEVRHITPTPEELALIPTTTLTPPPPASAAIPLCNRCHEHLVVKDGFCQFCTPPKQDDKALAVTRALASFSQNLERAWNGADGIWPDWMLRAREAKARVAELERALRPFAGLYDCIETTANEDGPAITETDTASVSIQCLRAARDALRKKAVAG